MFVKDIFLKRRLGLLIFWGCLIIFFLLLFRNPFSQRTLIPNFEPFPDTFHYVTAAISLINGEGLNITREGRKMTPSVAPLYSIVLLPSYFIKDDPRMFYFINIILSFLSFVLFYLILKKIIQNLWIIGFVLFLYTTNYFLYWYPTLAMAENLILPLFLAAIWLLIGPLKLKYLVFAGIVSISFYATKYASIPLTVSFSALYFLKIVVVNSLKSVSKRNLAFFIGSILISYSIFFIFEYSRGNNLLNVLVAFKNIILTMIPINSGNSGSGISSQSSSPWFSPQFISVNISHYWNSLIGGSERFLWDFTPLVPKFVAILGLFGLGVGVFIRRYSFISFSLIIMLGSTVFFMSNFYAVDMRYIYHAIPTLLLGFGIFLSLIKNWLDKKKLTAFFYVLIVFLAAYYLVFGGAVRIKKQIMLNLKYSETPWYYISVLELNSYFTPDKIVNNKKPILISAMAPYLIDYFSNKNYTLLPLSKDQEFRQKWEIVWGPNDYSDLTKLYYQYLNNGYSLYVGRYGIGNVIYLNEEFNNLTNNFNMVKVKTACYEQCNIYKLEIKNEALIIKP